MDLSIIIVNWNTRDLLKESLEAIYSTVYGFRFEVFVVDNASTDGSQNMVNQEFSQVELIRNVKNLGFARANNQAINESCGQYILLLNSDAFLGEGTVTQMVDLMNADPKVGVTGARLFYLDGRPQLSYGPIPTLMTEFISLVGLDKSIRKKHLERPNPYFVITGWVDGACMMVRRSTLNEIGLLDEDFFMFSEEIDLCHRAFMAGWKVIHVPTTRVIHIKGGSTGIIAKRILMLYRSKLQFFAKHYGSLDEHKLLRVMRFVTWMKVFVYKFIRIVSLGKIHKDVLWLSVAMGLKNI